MREFLLVIIMIRFPIPAKLDQIGGQQKEERGTTREEEEEGGVQGRGGEREARRKDKSPRVLAQSRRGETARCREE